MIIQVYPSTLHDALTSSIIKAGDTVTLHGGEYIISGTQDWICTLHGVTIQSYPGETAILLGVAGTNNLYFGLDAYDIILDGLIFDGNSGSASGLKIADGSYNITIRNCEIRNFGVHGVLITGITTHDITIEDCYIHHCGIDDILEHGIYSSSPDVIIQRCEVSYCGGHGIHIYGGAITDTTLIERCYCHDNGRIGIGIYTGDCTVKNNVCRGNGLFALSVRYDIINANIVYNTFFGEVSTETFYRAAAVDLINNVITTGYYGIEASGLGTATVGVSNCLVKGTAADYSDSTGLILSNNVNAEFTPITDSGESIIPLTGNPAIGAGVAVAGITTDYGGNVRGNPPTIGAWEA